MDARIRRLLSSEAGQPLPERARWVGLSLLGLGCGLSPFFFGYFDPSVWGPLALGLTVVLVALLVARPAAPTGLAAVAAAGLIAFAVWSLLSTTWAESAERALLEGDRWVLYGVFFLIVLLLTNDRRDAAIFLGAAVLGVLAVAGHDMVEMLSGDGPALFGASRLLEPLGYTNGLGGYFLLGFWPLAAVAERAPHPLLGGLCAGGASLLASLVLLTESRGTLFAFALSAVVLLALLPGRNRRAWLLVVILAGLAIAWGPLTDVTAPLANGRGAPPADTIQRGAEWALLSAGLVTVAWSIVAWVAEAIRDGGGASRDRMAVASAVVLVLAALVALAVVLPKDPVGKVSDQYDAFTSLKKVESGNRFTSGGGNRYDYWRIAWKQFEDHPVAGVGAGNFDRTYFVDRRTDEDVRQAHSIEVGTLGETGLIGVLALATFLGAVLIGLWRRAAAARREHGLEVGLTVAAGGVLLVWLGQTSVDWLHLIPGLTGLALGAAAILLLPAGGTTRPGGLPLPGLVVAVALAIVAIVLVGRPTLATHLRSQADAELAAKPAAALTRVDESLSLEPDAMQGYYLKAAALARLGSYPLAREALEEAIEREPHNFVSWGLLGDLTTRRGDFDAALRAYSRASALNPRDRGLRLLGSRRALLVRLHRQPDEVGALTAAGE